MGVIVVVLGAETWAIVSVHRQLDTIRPEHQTVRRSEPEIATSTLTEALDRGFLHAGDHHHFAPIFGRLGHSRPIRHMSWDPWRELERGERRLDNQFATFFDDLGQTPLISSFENIGWNFPNIELKEDANRYLVTADIPGASPNDVDVSLRSNQLTISGTRAEDEQQTGPNGSAVWTEHTMRHFERTLTLPGPVDQAGMTVNMSNGVLEVSVPKVIGQHT